MLTGVNTHFLIGMYMFAYLIGVRSYFNAGTGMLGQSVAGLAVAGLLFMVGIVNRGVASGSGDGQSYGANVLGLFTHYISLLVRHYTIKPFQFRVLEGAAIALTVLSLVQGARAVYERSQDD